MVVRISGKTQKLPDIPIECGRGVFVKAVEYNIGSARSASFKVKNDI